MAVGGRAAQLVRGGKGANRGAYELAFLEHESEGLVGAWHRSEALHAEAAAKGEAADAASAGAEWAGAQFKGVAAVAVAVACANARSAKAWEVSSRLWAKDAKLDFLATQKANA